MFLMLWLAGMFLLLLFIIGYLEYFTNVSAGGILNWFSLLSGSNLLVFIKNQNSYLSFPFGPPGKANKNIGMTVFRWG